MVADMNVSGVSQTQATSLDSPAQKAETNNTTTSFADVLESKVQKDSVGQSTPQKENETNSKQTSKSNDNKTLKQNAENTAQEGIPNPLTTKPSKTQMESTLTQALKGKTTDNAESDVLDDVEVEGETNKADADTQDSVLVKKDSKTIALAKNDNSIKTDLPTNLSQLQEESAENEIIDNELQTKDKNTKNIESKLNTTINQKDLQLKSLNEVKKESQARNLNLQKIEIIEQGKTTPIDPRDLMDRSVLEDNKERLSLSLQDKGRALSTSLAKMGAQELNEQAKKDALLAELLNRYDANANAKRKAQNEMEKLQFKVGDGDKSMIIERTAIQPKNITESKFRNEVMEQDFLEELHNITGDDELGELVDTNRAKLVAHAAQQIAKIGSPKDSSIVQKTYQGWAQQGQFLDAKEINDSKNTVFELEVQKPFDAVLAENLKTDSKTKESEVASKTEKKVDDSQKEKIESKQEAGAIQTKQEVSLKNAMAREAIKNFASQFRDEVLNYKPPITRINLELNPANLGQVAMTISKKGKDLQVSITSNANVMTMFVQNAQELRQNLMQIGFNNLDLNFSTHDGQGGNTQNNDSDEQKDRNIKLQSIEEAEAQTQLGNIPQSIEISLPQYA